MYYYAYDTYMSWYNWYYGIKPTQPEETKVEETKNEVEACPHTFPSLNESIKCNISPILGNSYNIPPNTLPPGLGVGGCV